jgi:tetratricopeptide (TPR) repeat protein
MIKGWFHRGERELTVDELIVLERYEEAEARLRTHLRGHGDDVHSRAKLAEVLSALGRSGEAVAEYSYVADLYRDDGFYDKAAALLLRAIKLDPKSDELRTLLTRVERDKSAARKPPAGPRRAAPGLGRARLHQHALRGAPVPVGSASPTPRCSTGSLRTRSACCCAT